MGSQARDEQYKDHRTLQSARPRSDDESSRRRPNTSGAVTMTIAGGRAEPFADKANLR